MNEKPDLLDESTLRRALRLENDERVPRFDVAAIAALASDTRPSTRTLFVVSVACAVGGLVAAGIWSFLAALAPDIVYGAVMFALNTVITIATLLEPVAEVAAQPVVPFSLLAALGVAIIHTLNERREHAHANAS